MGSRGLAPFAVVALLVNGAAIVACAVSGRATTPRASMGAPGLVGASTSDSVDYGESGPAVVSEGQEAGTTPALDIDGGFRCGCALCAPVFSEDKCTTPADCAPQQPCHAERCVARAKAKPRTPETVCTMEIRCSSADVNRCACLQGVCALAPPSQR